ncbi:MAG: FtsX-like permease family protein [Romboutsia sp.]|uniref:FtsX-like permease family protein n=1 Tax=Romboutsia sp. TaxID=1965302 RepID=UPI003F30A54D
MTMNNVISKLRKNSIKNYYMLAFCITLSVLLVTSYALMFFSPTVMNILPAGGDSRKQGYMIFSIAIVGCAVFTTYASTLFYKYKSREFGILMALGEKKSKLKKVLLKELIVIIPICLVVGVVLSIPVSYGIWKLFQVFIIDTKEMAYQFGAIGLIFGIVFCVFVTLCIFINGAKFIKRSNVMDVIYEQRKSEVVKDIKSWTGIVGWILVVVGLFLGYGVPSIVVNTVGYLMPSIWNAVYLLSLIGLYMIMTHAIIYSKKGKNPKKYYKNIISTNMMRFSGKQTVKNMCVITFLIAGGLFAALYGPTMMDNLLVDIKNTTIDYSFYYKGSEEQINKEEIYSLADNHDVSITDYYEVDAISLITNGYYRDYDENSMLVEEYNEKMQYDEFFSESDYNRISGQNIDVAKDEYYRIIVEGSLENIWDKWNDLEIITHPVTEESQKVKYAGTVSFRPFARHFQNKYVISDENYSKLSKGLPLEKYDKFVLFNVENYEETYAFAKELKDEIINRSSEDVAISQSYDEYEEMVANENGKEYWYSDTNVDLSPDNTQLFNEWKYYPMFKPLDSQDTFKNMAVFIMLFTYIAIICLAATAIITYTRAVTIGLDNKQLFLDIKKLGANNEYIEKNIKKQLAKVFIYPTVIGSIFTYMLYLTIYYGNSGGNISQGEALGLLVGLGIILIVILFMFVIYKISLKKVKNIAQI